MTQMTPVVPALCAPARQCTSTLPPRASPASAKESSGPRKEERCRTSSRM